MNRKYLALLAPAVIGLGGPVHAHHSFAATYFVDREITIDGTLTQFMFRNPHSFVKVNAKDDKGQPQLWSIEWGGGDHVVVTGNPGRDPTEHRIRLHKIVRTSDGWTWEGVIM
jgi:hypothetical protein